MSQAAQLQPPDHAADAEAAVVCACFFDLALIEAHGLRPEDFYLRPERTVLEALVHFRDQGYREVGVEAVRDRLHRTGRLADAGGAVGLARLLESVPAVADLSPLVRAIQESAQVRRVESTLTTLRLELRSGQSGDRLQLLDRVRRAVEQATQGAATTGLGLPVVDVGDVPETMPPTAFVCERLHLAPGRPACLVGYAGAGKTLLAADLALAVAAREEMGVTFWGGLVPDRRGRVLMLDFEVGAEFTQRRLLALTKGRWGSLKDWAGRLAFSSFPRWSLVAPRAEEQLVETLRGYTLCIIDSLAAITPGVDENGKGMADAMALLTRVSERTGCALLILHHEGKPPAEGPRAAHLRARGHSSIQGIWSSQWAVTSQGEGRLLLEHGKTQFEGGARPVIHTQICDVHDGEGQRVGVRLAPLGPVEAQEPGAPAPVPAGALAKGKAEVLAILGALGPTNVTDLMARLGVGKHTKYKALEVLQAEGKILKAVDPKDTRKVLFQLDDRDGSRSDREVSPESDRDGSRSGAGGIS